LREHTIGYFSELIKKARDIGFDKVVIRLNGEPISDDERSEKLKCSMDSLDRLEEMAFLEGVTITGEDLPRTCLGNTADELAKIVSVNDKLRGCFDTNHLLNDNNVNFMRMLRDKIITVHVSDYDFINERHWLPGEGKVGWKEVMTEFNQIGYEGVWMYEVGLVCPPMSVHDRDLTFDHFQNANNIHTPLEIRSVSRHGVSSVDEIVEEICETFGALLFDGATTLPETAGGGVDFSEAGSVCHGWSAVPCYIFDRYVKEEK